jgi:hypothetical protein
MYSRRSWNALHARTPAPPRQNEAEQHARPAWKEALVTLRADGYRAGIAVRGTVWT